MDEIRHTPGPWGRHNGIIALIDENNIRTKRIAEVKGGFGDEEAAANAQLIATSPELLDLVIQYRNDLRHPPSADSKERRLAAIEAVLAKIAV